MEEKKGKMFVNSPNALDGNYTEKCDTASAEIQAKRNRTYRCSRTEEEILAEDPSAGILLPSNFEDNDSFEECTDDLNRACEDI